MKRIIAWILTIAALTGLLVFSVLAAPGSSDDPVISLSYINDVLWPQLKEYVDSSLNSSGNISGTVVTPGHVSPEGMTYAESYTVISLKAGNKLIGGDGCEVIVRTGTVSIIASERGGIADVTAGLDLPGGAIAPANHLLIIPVNDGRGLTMNSDAYVMVKGDYKIA